MPILLKKINGSVISYFGPNNTNLLGGVKLINTVIGEVGLESYISLVNFEGFTQNFSSVIKADFCDKPTNIGPISCTNQTILNISY